MNKLTLLIKLVITGLGLILIFNNDNDSLWYIIFVALVIFYIIYESILEINRKRKNK
ncbi:MAG: hypothetical protein ABF649_19760 [Bacillus sp. (in: firmicutes)]